MADVAKLAYVSVMAPDELIEEQAYLIARGVRPLSLLGHCRAEPDLMLTISTRLERLSAGQCIPFVLDRGDGNADYGFAAGEWVLDLYAWLFRDASMDIPEKQKARIAGLLLGYGVEAIRAHEEGNSGRLFPVTNGSGGSTSS